MDVLTPKFKFYCLARITLVSFFFLLCCPGLVRNSTAWSVVQGTDSEGDSYVIKERPQRVVCLVPEITETLIAIDATDGLVGITKHTKAPEVSGIKKVGGFLSPEIRKIEALAPDLIIAADLHFKVREYFRGKCRILTLNVFSIESALERIQLLGRIFDREEAVGKVVAENRKLLDHVAQKVGDLEAGKKQRVIRLMGYDNLLVPGDNSFQNDYIRAIGAIAPVFGKRGQAVTVTVEEWQRFDPQVIYICGTGELPEILSVSGVKDVSAVRNGRVYSFSCNLTCRAGINIGNFVSLLADRVYGDMISGLSQYVQSGEPATCVMDEK